MRPQLPPTAHRRSSVALRVYVAVFLGGVVGGSARLAIDQSLEFDAWSWDIVAINIVGSGLLGAVVGWFAIHDAPWWIPGLGAGVLGGFTTFSAMAAPHPDARVPGVVLLVGTLVGASIAAGFGWRLAESLGLRHAQPLFPLDVEQAEAAVEGFERYNDVRGTDPHDEGQGREGPADTGVVK